MMEKIQLKLEGLSCEHCVHAVEHALLALNGVEKAAVSLAEQTAKITYDSALVTPDSMKKAIEEEGYRVL